MTTFKQKSTHVENKGLVKPCKIISISLYCDIHLCHMCLQIFSANATPGLNIICKIKVVTIFVLVMLIFFGSHFKLD